LAVEPLALEGLPARRTVAPLVSEVQDESISRQRDPELRRIVVIRHAQSSWDDPSLADHDRPLSKRGRKARSRLRDHIEGLELRPDLVMCSSSRRTRETLAGIRSAFGRKARVESDSELYAASAEKLVTELRRLDDQVTTVVLIGHNPGVADLVELLVSASANDEAAIDTFPTAAVAVLSVAGPWRALQPACASLESFWSPRRPG
jgi:phosphohistidine phosphatase